MINLPTSSGQVIPMEYYYNPRYLYELVNKNPEILQALDLSFDRRIKKMDKFLEENLISETPNISPEITQHMLSELYPEDNIPEEFLLLEERVVNKTKRKLELKMTPQGSNEGDEQKQKQKQKMEQDYKEALKPASPSP